MKIGSLVYATNQGLGILAKSFYDAGVVTDVAVIAHGKHVNHWEWYPNCERIHDLNKDLPKLKEFCLSMDAVLFFETPFVWNLIDYCRQGGIKTALMPMHECMPNNLPAMPDLFLNPSLLEQACYPQGIFIPVPVKVPWRLRVQANVFVCNMGHGGLKDRNGASELFAAISLCKTSPKLIIRSQSSRILEMAKRLPGAVVQGEVGYQDLWHQGDVFLFPEKFNGLSLPLQEARAAGMLVMASNRFPVNQWLPMEPLIHVGGYRISRIGPSYRAFEEAIVSPESIAKCIDAWNGAAIESYSLSGRQWAEGMSWEALKPKYMRVLHSLIE